MGIRAKKLSLLMLIGVLILIGPLFLGLGEQRAGARTDGCWTAEVTEQWIDTDLVGSVLRVSVEGIVGLPVTVRSMGSFKTIGYTGTKGEYGPYVAEFAPLTRGTYFIEPQGLGLSFEIFLDGKNYTRVDFRPLPCTPPPTPVATTAVSRPAATVPQPQPTATRQPPTAPTPIPPPSQPAAGWQGRVVEHRTDLEGRHYATIAVRVVGRPAGQEVEIESGSWRETCKTGTKPDHGPDACEFGALRAGPYRLTPTGLGTHLDLAVELQDFVLVEFYYTGPTPSTHWVGSVVDNTSGDQPTEHANSAIAVDVSGRPWHEVEIRAGGWTSTCTTGTKPEYGADACEFGGLRAGTYTITSKDLGPSVEVTMDGWGWAMVRFVEVAAPEPLPPAATEPTSPPPTSPPAGQAPAPTPVPSATPTGPQWQGHVVSNTSGDGEETGIWSVIVVRVLNWDGVPVEVSSGGGWSATCITGTKPEYGPDACEFGGLWPGTYFLQPEGADIQVEVEMDGLGMAIVEFAAP